MLDSTHIKCHALLLETEATRNVFHETKHLRRDEASDSQPSGPERRGQVVERSAGPLGGRLYATFGDEAWRVYTAVGLDIKAPTLKKLKWLVSARRQWPRGDHGKL